MGIRSLGLRTDVALLALGGSVVEDHGDQLVIRTPDNPTFWWGNFLLLGSVPAPAETSRWLARFDEAPPDARHIALAVDTVTGGIQRQSGFAAAGMTVEASTVMTARSVHEPPHSLPSAGYRAFVGDCCRAWGSSAPRPTATRAAAASPGRSCTT